MNLRVPILLNFDHTSVIGWVEISKDAVKNLDGGVLSPGIIKKDGGDIELIEFGLINFIENKKEIK